MLRRRASLRSVVVARRSAQGHKVAAVMLSAVVDAAPTEFQAYSSVLWDMTIGMAGCDGSVWAIEGARVTQISPGQAKATCPDPWQEK